MLSADDAGTDCDGNVVPGELHESPALELERQKCLDDIRNRIIEDYRPFFENVSKVVLYDVALHKNLGDTVLWRAAIHLVTLFGRTVDYVCAASQRKYKHLEGFPRCKTEHVVQLVKDNGLVMYHAGGNWGNLYRRVQLYRMRVLRRFGHAFRAENTTFKVIQLPQSIAYTPDEVTDVTEDDAIINSLPFGMFTLLTRQDDSFVWAKQHYGNNIDIRPSPDIAFALGQLAPIGKPTVDVIFIMRWDKEDKERGTNLEQRVAARFAGTGLTYKYQDWGYVVHGAEYSSAVPTVLSEVRLNAAIRTISSGRVLVTNRFHGHIVGMMMGKTTFWTDTIQGKLKHTRAVAFNSSEYCTAESMRSFGFKTTMDAVDAAISYLLHSVAF